MRELIEAAVQSAARSGIQAAVVMVDGSAAGGVTFRSPAAAAQGGSIDAQQQIAALQEHLSAAAQARDSALRQNEQLSQQFREAQARIAQLESQGGGQAPAPDQPTEIVDHESLGIATLNLPEKVVKVCSKNEIQTIGQLRAFYPQLGEYKINQKDRITTAEALMGRISMQTSAAQAAPASSAPSGDTPAGHTDRPWTKRLEVARFKENKGAQLIAGLKRESDAIREIVPSFPEEGEADFWDKALVAVFSSEGEDREKAINLLAKYIGGKVVQEITSAQVAAMIYALGLDPKTSREIDQALESAGLIQFVETVPEPVGA